MKIISRWIREDLYLSEGSFAVTAFEQLITTVVVAEVLLQPVVVVVTVTLYLPAFFAK